MNRGVGIVVHAEQQHLTIELVHPPHRTFRHMGGQRERIGQHPISHRPRGGEGERVLAPKHAGKLPEGAGNHAEVGRCS